MKMQMLMNYDDAESCIGRQVINHGDVYEGMLSCRIGDTSSIVVAAHVAGHDRRVQVVGITSIPHNSESTIADAICKIAAELNISMVMVDTSGMGIAVCHEIENMGITDINRVHVGNPCFLKKDKDQFFNRRAQGIMCASRAARDGRLGIDDGPLCKELLDQMTRVPVSFDERGRYKIASNEEMHQAGLTIPDIFYAVSLLF